jgi:hypothetical protein
MSAGDMQAGTMVVTHARSDTFGGMLLQIRVLADLTRD